MSENIVMAANNLMNTLQGLTANLPVEPMTAISFFIALIITGYFAWKSFVKARDETTFRLSRFQYSLLLLTAFGGTFALVPIYGDRLASDGLAVFLSACIVTLAIMIFCPREKAA